MRDNLKFLSLLDRVSLQKKLSATKYLLCLMVCAISFGITVTAAPFDLDQTFGSGGRVYSNPPGLTDSYGYGMARQADGKIILVGSDNNTAGNPGYVIARYNVDGSLDSSFGNGGWVYATFGATVEYAAAVDVQADGKIVVGGYSDGRAAIMRLNPDGSFDSTFDGDGKAFLTFLSFENGRVNAYLTALKVAPDGKIVVAGYALGFNSITYTVIGKLNSNGSPDTSFAGGGGIFDGSNGRWVDLVVKADGSIYVAGFNPGQLWSTRNAKKFSNTGASEWTYSFGTSNLGQYTAFNGIALQPDGKVVAVGYTNNDGNGNKLLVVRLNENGTSDGTFNSSASTNLASIGRAVAVQPNGKIIVSTGGFGLLRLNSNGTPDNSLVKDGAVKTLSPSGCSEIGNRLVIQPDGKFLVGGSSGCFAMARYLGDSVSVPSRTLFDYDGDGKADISVFRPSENRWYVLRSSNFSVIEQVFAIAGDIPVPADYDGDGKTDFAIFRPGSADWWYLSSINGAQLSVQWGQTGDIPRPSDVDGDGKTDFVVYRPSNNTWYRLTSTAAVSSIAFGAAGDQPLVGDFDGDGRSDPAIFRPSSGDWWYAASSQGGRHTVAHWGASGDIPAPGDYDGDGKTDFVVFRPSDGGWYILYSTGSYTIATFGTVGDKPIAADYDGDGKADVAVFRPSTGIWYLLQTTSGFGASQFGIGTDIPTENSFNP